MADKSSKPMTWIRLMTAVVLTSCGSGEQECTRDLQPCSGGVCLLDRCEPLEGDADFDGLSNEDEVALGSNPLNWDTDDDQRSDIEEVGGSPANPTDSDGDGVPDVLESLEADADSDCLPDQLDNNDDDPNPPEGFVALHNCSREGVCATGFGLIRFSCLDGVAFCDYSDVPGWMEQEVLCDQRDNNCDGEVDEGFTSGGIPIGFQCEGEGICGLGIVECAEDGTSTRCSTEPGGVMDGSEPEICDGLDNDCDGLIDNGLLYGDNEVGEPCDGKGKCGTGTVECSQNGNPICSTDPTGSEDQSTTETCDGKDDDCDGEEDNDVAIIGSPTEVCKPKGICATHTDKAGLVCLDGKEVCDYSLVPGYSGPQESVCSGEDDDCDGLVDEDFWILDPAAGKVHVGEPCGVGACAGGTVACAPSGNFATCSSLDSSIPEICDQNDNDCDGAVDNGLKKVFSDGAVKVSDGEPGPRAGAAFVHHAPSDSLYIYGGAGQVGNDTQVNQSLSDFWRFDLQTHRFSELAGDVPGLRSGATLLDDPTGSRLLLVGGLPKGIAEGPVWAYRLDDGQWAEIPVSIPQEGTAGAALDPDTWSVFLVRTDTDIVEDRLVRVSLETLEVTTAAVDLPYRRHAATAYQPDTGVLFISGGFNPDGVPTDDLFAVEPDGTVWPVLEKGNLPARSRHAITVLSDGSILFFGGVKSGGLVSADIFRIWPDTGVVEPVAAAPPPGLQMPSLSSGGMVAWLYSGMDQSGHGFRQVMRFDTTKTQWTQEVLQVAPSGKAWGSLAVLGTRKTAYLFGGLMEDISSSNPTTDIWALSLVSGIFKHLAMEGEPPVLIRGAVAVDESTESIYLFGGFTDPPEEGGVATSKFQKFDPDEPIIENLSDPDGPAPRHDHSLIWTGNAGTLLLYGGLQDDNVYGDVWSFTTEAGWSDLQAVPHPSFGHLAFWDAEGGRMLTVGGSPSGTLSAFDPVYRTWSVLAEHPVLVSSQGSAFFDIQSREILFLSGEGEALVLSIPATGDAQIVEHVLSPYPPGKGVQSAYDPFGRRALLLGGIRPQGGTASWNWEISQICP